MEKHEEISETVCMKGYAMMEQRHFASKDIEVKIELLRRNFVKLKELLQDREDRLRDAEKSLQVNKVIDKTANVTLLMLSRNLNSTILQNGFQKVIRFYLQITQ